MAVVLGGLVAAQGPRTAAPPGSLVVAITAIDAGTATPRPVRADAPAAAAATNQWVDRRMHCRVADTDVVGVAAVAAELRRHAADARANDGVASLPPVRIEPCDGARWHDVVQVFDAAREVGFARITLAGVDTEHIVPRSIEEPVLDLGALVVPQAYYVEDDTRPHALRATFDVHQDGRVSRDGKTLFTPVREQPDDLTALRAQLRELRNIAVRKRELRPRPGDRRPALDVPLLVRADLWAEWRDVRRLLTTALERDLGFWKLELGLTRFDVEARMRYDAAQVAATRR